MDSSFTRNFEVSTGRENTMTRQDNIVSLYHREKMSRTVPRTQEDRRLTTPGPVLLRQRSPEDIAWLRDTHKTTVETLSKMTQTRLVEDLMKVQLRCLAIHMSPYQQGGSIVKNVVLADCDGIPHAKST